MSHPRAFTLVEMLVSISVGSVLMTLALGLVQRSMSAESASRAHALIERNAARLSRQFRHDIHQARSVTLDDQQTDAPLLQLVLPNQLPVSYLLGDGGVLRQQPRVDGQTYREFYAFPDDHAVQFGALTDPPRAVLTLEYDTRLIGIEPQVKLHVEAVIGLQLRPGPDEEDSQ